MKFSLFYHLLPLVTPIQFSKSVFNSKNHVCSKTTTTPSTKKQPCWKIYYELEPRKGKCDECMTLVRVRKRKLSYRIVKFDKEIKTHFCCKGWLSKSGNPAENKDCTIPECGRNTLAKCKNGGKCHKSRKRCNCSKGWGGNYCERDKNECKNYKKDSLCSENQKCVNLMGSFKCESKRWLKGIELVERIYFRLNCKIRIG